MDSAALKALQAPLKEQYLAAPEQAMLTLRAESNGVDGIACKLATSKGIIEAGLHPATGGSGAQACSGDMLLEALVACAGVTLQAVATAFGITLTKSHVSAEGDLDFRGTLGVAKDAPVGFSELRLTFDIAADAPPETLAKIIATTERYCVVLQTLHQRPHIAVNSIIA
ncbi:MAG: OsmC family peroxiredoxin [Gammaproteobacteria bacterium]|nr:OsmC family peroxiredoxin [Gammaproteobacteria bacterium]